MPRFFFHLHNDMDVADEEGEDLPDIEAARAFAMRQARALAADTARQRGEIDLRHRIDIEDEEHRLVGSVTFGDAVEIRR
jgi:hypothetical protein